MKREKEFRAYLQKNKISTKNVGYCRDHIEKAFGGKDMDEIIAKHQNISNVHNKLTGIGEPVASINAYMVALNHYLKFIIEQGKKPTFVVPPEIPTLIENPILPKKKKGLEQRPITPPRQGRDENRNIVYYNDNVGINERVEGLCQQLELEYLEYVTNFARDIFRDLINEDFYIPKVELCKECPSEVWIHDDSYVTTKINKLIAKGVPVNESEIACILRHRSRILGEFIHKPQPLIKIYFNQFNSADRYDWSGYFAKISQTLAHEYMHYLEYQYRFGIKSYKNANVSEALADFFGVIYSLKRATDRYVITAKDRIEVAEQRYNEWVELEGSGWPYAYALYFMKKRIMDFSPVFAEYYSEGCIDKFKEVFVATLNPKDAYDILTKL